jgi:CBS domain-containing protein
MLCPNCGHDNIQGTDLCASCGSDLAGLDLPEAHPGFRGRLMTDHVGDLSLISPPPTVRTDTTAAAAITLMRDARNGCVLVRDNSDLVGIFTERDVLTRLVRPGRDPEQVVMSEVMTPQPITLAPSDPPAHAIHLSATRGIRHLPVVEGDSVLGFLSVRHLLRHIHEHVLGND